MCTDNMPSGSAYKLGDVLTARNGTTVEVKNTDAEGRLVMWDGLVLATEERAATRSSTSRRSPAPRSWRWPAHRGPARQRRDAGRRGASGRRATTDEQVWQLPLEQRYRKQLDSDIADISNLGGPYAGATTAALFLAEFVDGIPWAHLDIAGTMQSDTDDAWRSKGATGFGTRPLIDLAQNFSRP